jgi:O-Antigen ligase
LTETTQAHDLGRRPPERVFGLLIGLAPTLLVAAATFVVGYDNGGFGEPTRDTLAIVLWWLVILGIGFGICPLARIPLPAFVTGGLLCGLALFTLLSTAWASDAAGAYAEFTRVLLYLAVFVLAVIASSRASAEGWTNGLALGIVAIAGVALVSRLFPHTFQHRTVEINTFLPTAKTRLNFPVGYWNGLAILVALGIPLLLRAAVAARSALVRGLALVPIPVIAGVIYLASSRTGVVAAIVGPLVFFALSPRRWSAFCAVVVSAAGSACAVWTLYDRNSLVNGPLKSAAAVSEGRSAALIIAGICVLTGLAYGLGSLSVPKGFRPSPVLGWILLVCFVALVIAGIAAAHPVRRFEAFKRLPSAHSSRSAIEAHLLSKSGNGRWQLWKAAGKQFESSPLHGRGGGSYEQWWLQHGTLASFATEAHSLYLETLGELGIIGFVLLATTFIAGVTAALSRLWRAPPDQRAILAAATGTFVAYAVAAAADWMWELTIVSVVAIACLGLISGPATEPPQAPRAAYAKRPRARSSPSRYALGIAVLLGSWLAICATAVPLLAGSKIQDSQHAVGQRNTDAALKDALEARSIQPWSSAPYLQLALVTEQAGRLRTGERWIVDAVRHSPENWQLWFTRARIETELGRIAAAKQSLARARQLNPRSPIFSAS